MIFFRTYAGTFLAVLLLIGCGGSASAQVSVSVYGGYVNLEGPRWLGHGNRVGTVTTDVVFDKVDSGFYGLSILSETGVEFYIQGLSANDSAGQRADANVVIRSPTGGPFQFAIGSAVGSSVFTRTRLETGFRKTLFENYAGWQLFASPFLGIGRDQSLVFFESPAATIRRDNTVRWHYVGMDVGIARSFALLPGIALVANASLGAYSAIATGGSVQTGTFFGPLNEASAFDDTRWGYRAQGSLELKTRINEVFSASLLGQAVYWSDVPHASFLSNSNAFVEPPIRLGYDDMTEFRMLLKLTAKIGSAP